MSSSSSQATSPSAPQPQPVPAAPAPPNIHERALIIWSSIFPLVAIGLWVFGPLMAGWHPVLRAFALTIVIVPTAVYLVVPRFTKLYLRIARRR
ncbi:hypothetical protein SPF06_20170 [Sinomonas sp. JGH33]|uniref:Uncharacterized protein n=1 Tax=Sinomonas terricola TaxID=3110330 RepID=A0ABU5TBY3_9MICC|nr:hypothetical protein [Sinomonas sp. JGH33]MEA5457047.1 hypothetical protein [Sinomonas sp. JGH33]